MCSREGKKTSVVSPGKEGKGLEPCPEGPGQGGKWAVS